MFPCFQVCTGSTLSLQLSQQPTFTPLKTSREISNIIMCWEMAVFAGSWWAIVFLTWCWQHLLLESQWQLLRQAPRFIENPELQTGDQYIDFFWKETQVNGRHVTTYLMFNVFRLYIRPLLSKNFLKFGTNIYKDSRMTWLDLGGQRWRRGELVKHFIMSS